MAFWFIVLFTLSAWLLTEDKSRSSNSRKRCVMDETTDSFLPKVCWHYIVVVFLNWPIPIDKRGLGGIIDNRGISVWTCSREHSENYHKNDEYLTSIRDNRAMWRRLRSFIGNRAIMKKFRCSSRCRTWKCRDSRASRPWVERLPRTTRLRDALAWIAYSKEFKYIAETAFSDHK